MPRPAGTPNRNKDRLLRTLKAEYGDDFDPIMKMAEIASNNNNDDTLKLSAWKEVAQYVYPKLKAVEVSGDLGVHQETFEEWQARCENQTSSDIS